MASLEILASLHDSFVHLLVVLLRCDPGIVLSAIARARTGLPEGKLLERQPQFEIPGLARRAHRRVVDAFITIHDEHDGRVRLALVLEFQDSKDADKRWIWPEVATAAAAEFRAPGEVAVLAITPEIHAWLERLLPRLSPQPVHVRASHVDRIVELDQARARPLAAIFAGIYQCLTAEPLEERVAGIRATLVALAELDVRHGWRYSVLVALSVPKPMLEQAKRQLTDAGELPPEQMREIDAFVRRSYAFGLGVDEGLEQGREQGLEQGRRRELRRALVDILAVRGVELSGAARTVIGACEELEQLDRWYERAKSAPVDELGALFEAQLDDRLDDPLDPR